MATVKSYDPRCFELAKLFLSDVPELDNEPSCHSLALEIQQCIEDEIYFMRNEPHLYSGFTKEAVAEARKECVRHYGANLLEPSARKS
jgi:hypothetical protein